MTELGQLKPLCLPQPKVCISPKSDIDCTQGFCDRPGAGGWPVRMQDDLQKLTDREKETLRLLLAGHDAKSAARFLGLSVHTVNERLRDARSKLGVSSSREAARRLAEA